MAEKVLKTKIKLRYDTYAKWTAANPILEKGEIAVVEIDTKDPANKLLPPIMFKVGNGQTKQENGETVKLRFKDLNWSSALAADVYDWAKAPQKPTYNYSEIQNLPTIPTDTDTQYRLVLSGHTLKLQSKPKNGSWADISGQSFTLPDENDNTTYEFDSTATSGAYFNVTPSGGTKTPVYIDGLGTAAFKAVGDFATAAQGAKADSALQSHQSIKTLDTTSTTALTPAASEAIAGSGTIKLHKVSKTGSYNDLLNKPTIPTIPNIEIADPSGSGNVITGLSASGHKITPTKGISVYTKNEVNSLIAGAVDYLGTVASMANVTALAPDSEGDFCRVSAGFTLTATSSGTGADVELHAGDLLLCKTLKSGTTPAKWDVIHGEIDKNTWTANSATSDGYVAKTGGAANKGKVWKVDAEGNPGWLADDNTNTSHTHTNGVGLIRTGDGGTSGTVDYKVALKSETKNANAALAVPAANAGKFYPVEVDKDGKLAVTVPWTDTKVTSATNHYTPSAETASQLSVDASSAVAATWDSTSMVTGVNIQRDSKGHVTGVTVDSVKMPANPNTDHNQKVKSGSVTFGANDEVNIIGATGSGIKATGNQSAKSITIDWDDTVTLVFDCGDSNGPV